MKTLQLNLSIWIYRKSKCFDKYNSFMLMKLVIFSKLLLYNVD